MEINYLKRPAIIEMKSIIIKPSTNKEFDLALSWMNEFSKPRKRITLMNDDEIGFTFMMNVVNVKADDNKEVVRKTR